MDSDASRNLVQTLVLAAAGAVVALAATRGLYATALLAAVVIAWTAALRLVDRRVPLPAPPTPHVLPDEEARRRLTAYLDLSPAPLISLEDGRLRVVNRAARRLLHTSDLVPDPPAALLAAMSETRPGRTARIELHDDGNATSFALTTGDLALSGQILRIGALIDIDTELKAAEAAALRDLVQVLSHEIVNALTPIASLAATAVAMLDDPAPAFPQVRDAIETVARRAASLHRFGESYRSLARLPQPSFARIAVAPFAGDLAMLFATRWPAIDLMIETQAPVHLMVDADQITAALWALLQNAAEALHDTADPKVRLVFEALVSRTRIAIIDNGPGIAAADEADIFRPFFTTKAEGTGVGLSLARQIFRGHGGDLALISTRAGETVFEATLPV